MTVFHASESLENVRLHWNEHRCNPIYMPFANSIRPDVSVEANFQYCMNQFAHNMFKFIIDEMMSMIKGAASGVADMGESLPGFRSVFARMRKVMLSFAAQTFGKIANSMGSISYILIKIRDILKRFVGEGYIAAFLAQTGMDFMYSFIMFIITIIKIFVYSLLAISIILALFQPEMLVLAVIIASLIGASGF